MSLSAVVSNLQLNWIDGVSGDDVLEKALPPGDHKFISPGSKGSWRAHMNALQAALWGSLSSPSPSHPDRVTIPDDITVPEPQHLKPHPLSAIDDLATSILCTRESCIARMARPAAWHTHSQRGARKLLYEFGVRELSRGYDFMLSDWCDGLMFGFRDLQDPESPEDSEDLGATVRVLQAA
ncbi:glycosyltransferase family 25 protein [Cenococcum geophilum 1.58]|uniref:glycosyltransferase family 25 protein n=1 Tax=Cenococcum geophilum 1.58 TaxID=794803 RepID=UPI00358ECB48|nr:glycosyltransferase family 25 protein [Cenococcum geophilum 1.58]